jgi:hypothetical protein
MKTIQLIFILSICIASLHAQPEDEVANEELAKKAIATVPEFSATEPICSNL